MTFTLAGVPETVQFADIRRLCRELGFDPAEVRSLTVTTVGVKAEVYARKGTRKGLNNDGSYRYINGLGEPAVHSVFIPAVDDDAAR